MHSRLGQRVLRVIGSPNLRPVDAAVLSAFGQVLASLFAVLLHVALRRPDIPVEQLEVIRQAWLVQINSIPFNVGLVLLGLIVGRRSPDGNLLAHLSIQHHARRVGGEYLRYTHVSGVSGVSAVIGVPVLGLPVFAS